MNRTGFEKNEINTVIKTKKEHVFLKGLCTHYAGAESIANYYRVDKQIKDSKIFINIYVRMN
jgi:alanine racemase